jgi:hypothetical protein
MSNFMTTKRLIKYSQQAKEMYTNADHCYEWEQQEGSMETLIEEFHREYLEDSVSIGYFRAYLYQYFIRISEVDNLYMAKEYMLSNGFWESIGFDEVWLYLNSVSVDALIRDILAEVFVYQEILRLRMNCREFFAKVYEKCGYALLSDDDLQEYGVGELEADCDELKKECDELGLDFHQLSCEYAHTKAEYSQRVFEPTPTPQPKSEPFVNEIFEAVNKVSDSSVRLDILLALSNYFTSKFNNQ